ncbi:MAG: DUF3868 domain-containing protein, partial [Tannerellaceae bacterium]|nr:DUF3868 domain-containing protein [Tannerellaceae bacterium]
MKKIYTTGMALWAGLLVTATFDVHAQTEALIFDGQIPVKIQRLRQAEDSVQLVMDIDLANVKIGTERSLVLTPVLVSPQGREVKMKSVMLNGRRRHKAFMREMALNGWEREAKDTHYDVIPLTGENRTTHRYTQAVVFESWMREARMDIETDLCGCAAGSVQQTASEKVANRIVLEGAKEYRTLPNVAYVRPEAEQVKARSESADVFLDFPVARTEINPGFGNNPRELAKIEQIMNEIRT